MPVIKVGQCTSLWQSPSPSLELQPRHFIISRRCTPLFQISQLLIYLKDIMKGRLIIFPIFCSLSLIFVFFPHFLQIFLSFFENILIWSSNFEEVLEFWKQRIKRDFGKIRIFQKNIHPWKKPNPVSIPRTKSRISL